MDFSRFHYAYFNGDTLKRSPLEIHSNLLFNVCRHWSQTKPLKSAPSSSDYCGAQRWESENRRSPRETHAITIRVEFTSSHLTCVSHTIHSFATHLYSIYLQPAGHWRSLLSINCALICAVCRAAAVPAVWPSNGHVEWPIPRRFDSSGLLGHRARTIIG